MNPNTTPLPPPHLGGEHLAADAVDLDGATVDQTGSVVESDTVIPDADLDEVTRDTDGSLVGRADADADAER